MNKRPIPYLKWQKVLVYEVVLPILVVSVLGFLCDQFFFDSLVHKILSVPTYGARFHGTKAFRFLQVYHLAFFVFPPLILVTVASWQSQGLGPGRALLRFFGEGSYPLFPPTFSYGDPEVQKVIAGIRKSEPLARVIGFYKRFSCDIDQARRDGGGLGGGGQYFPIVLGEGLRYRHVQVVGSTGSGKSASVIAPILYQDAMTTDLATFTINPKSDTYLIKCMVSGVLSNISRNQEMVAPPTALISMVRKQSLAYDPLIYGTADICTKKIIGSMEFESSYYKGVQETWLMTFFRVVKTEPALTNRVMLRHLLGFLVTPISLQTKIKPLVSLQENIDRIDVLSLEKRENLSGVAAHIAGLVEDESLGHIFNNPDGHYLDLREVIRAGGNIFVEVDTNAKGPQSRALGRMLIMELQLLASARQASQEPSSPGVMAFVDEFASFSYNDFIGLLDKSRSAKVGFLLAHQSIGNFQRSYLSQGFKHEVIDNTRTKFLLDIKDETAKWASQVLGEQRMALVTESIGTATDSKMTRTSKSTSTRQEWDVRAVPDVFNLELGKGFSQLQDSEGRLINCPVTLGYIDEAMLCSDDELIHYLDDELVRHPRRPLNGSLIDNDVPFSLPSSLKAKNEAGGVSVPETPPAVVVIPKKNPGLTSDKKPKAKRVVSVDADDDDALDTLLKSVI
jgi:hypothetical protein